MNLQAQSAPVDCEIGLHLAKYQGDVSTPPEKTGDFSHVLIKPEPFITRFDMKSTGVGTGDKERFVVLHLTSAGKESLEKVTSTSIGMRMAAVQRIGKKNRVLWVWRIRSAMKSSMIPVPLKTAREAAWMSHCLNKRIGGSATGGGEKKKRYEF
jgi:hypothetical protein